MMRKNPINIELFDYAQVRKTVNKREKKRSFLKRLQSPSKKNKYKRYLGSPIRYAGGKSLAVGYILEQIPDTITQVVSPFIGGASIEIALAHECDISVLGFDVFDILTNYWKVQTCYPKELADRLEKWQPTKEQYQKVKFRLKSHWERKSILSDRLELAAHYWFNHNLSYGPGFLGWMSKIYAQKNRYESLVERVRTFQADSFLVESGDFKEVIDSHKNDFLYCDPPYYLDGDSRMFRGIYPQRNFPVHHKGFEHESLRDLLYSHRGGFVLSYNDCSPIREWYKDFEIIEIAWQYTLGQGETRIGTNRENGQRDHVKASHEILVVKK